MLGTFSYASPWRLIPFSLAICMSGLEKKCGHFHCPFFIIGSLFATEL